MNEVKIAQEETQVGLGHTEAGSSPPRNTDWRKAMKEHGDKCDTLCGPGKWNRYQNPVKDSFAEEFGVLEAEFPGCAMRLFGQRCCRALYRGDHLPPYRDHATRWLKDGRSLLYTYQPYGPPSEFVISAIESWCTARGLAVEFSARSWWYPGWTYLVIIRRAEVSA